MSIFDYILKYGKYTFSEMNFNEIDNVIFASLSYLNLEGIVSKSAKNKINIGEIYKILSKKKHKQHHHLYQNIKQKIAVNHHLYINMNKHKYP